MTILIVDDNKDIIDLMLPHFQKEKFEIIIAYDGLEGLNKFNTNIDIVLLDIMMPKMDGTDLCKRIREISNVPIIMITAKSTDEDVIENLGIGADDYIIKPFSPKQVVAKVKALLRRINIEDDKNIIKNNYLYINMDKYETLINNKSVSLTKREVEILYLMASHPNRIYPREILLETLWGDDYFGDVRTIDTHIKRLRNKIKNEYFDIKTVWGVGYKYEEN